MENVLGWRLKINLKTSSDEVVRSIEEPFYRTYYERIWNYQVIELFWILATPTEL